MLLNTMINYHIVYTSRAHGCFSTPVLAELRGELEQAPAYLIQQNLRKILLTSTIFECRAVRKSIPDENA